MSLPGPRFTYEDYRLLPEDKRYEIIEGELLVTPAPTDVILANETVVQPDLLFVAANAKGVFMQMGYTAPRIW